MQSLATLPLPPARPVAHLRSELDLLPPRERLAFYRAHQTLAEAERIQCSGTTGTWTELAYTNMADFSAFNNSASEGSLLAGNNDQPVIPALFFFNKQGRFRNVLFKAWGVLSTTSTPTIQFQVRSGTTSGSSFLSGASVGQSAVITTAPAGVTNVYWTLELVLNCYV